MSALGSKVQMASKCQAAQADKKSKQVDFKGSENVGKVGCYSLISK